MSNRTIQSDQDDIPTIIVSFLSSSRVASSDGIDPTILKFVIPGSTSDECIGQERMEGCGFCVRCRSNERTDELMC